MYFFTTFFERYIQLHRWSEPDYRGRTALLCPLVGLAFSLLLAAACLIRNRHIVAAAFPIRYLGKISYGIYLWHLPVILLLEDHGSSPWCFIE